MLLWLEVALKFGDDRSKRFAQSNVSADGDDFDILVMLSVFIFDEVFILCGKGKHSSAPHSYLDITGSD